MTLLSKFRAEIAHILPGDPDLWLGIALLGIAACCYVVGALIGAYRQRTVFIDARPYNRHDFATTERRARLAETQMEEEHTPMKFKDFALGATGRYPHGKASQDDEGELQMLLVADHAEGIVRIVFGKRVGWLGLPSGHARQLAAMLIEKAEELDKRKA